IHCLVRQHRAGDCVPDGVDAGHVGSEATIDPDAALVVRLRGGNATDVQAGAAEGLVLLDYGNLHAELCRADGADIAAGAGADDDEIVGHDYSELSVVTAADGDRLTDPPRASPDPPKVPSPAPETTRPLGR